MVSKAIRELNERSSDINYDFVKYSKKLKKYYVDIDKLAEHLIDEDGFKTVY